MTDDELAAIEARVNYTDEWGPDNRHPAYVEWLEGETRKLVAEVRRLRAKYETPTLGNVTITPEMARNAVDIANGGGPDDTMRRSIAAQIERGGGDGKPGGSGMPYGY